MYSSYVQNDYTRGIELVRFMANFLKKAQNGTVVVQSNEGRLRLQLPIHLFDGKQKFIYLNMADTVENRELAQAKAQIIEADIKFEEFDSTLKKYKPPTYLTVVESIEPKAEITFSDLFQRYLLFKKPTLKETTFNYLIKSIQVYIDRYPHTIISDENALEICQWLLKNTTNSMTKRVLTHLNAAIKWGIKFNLISLKTSPLEGMAQELPKHNWEIDPQPNAFTPDEKARIIKAFEEHQGNWNGRGFSGIAYSHYAPLVKFWLYTGCRPSEGIGLTWGQITPDCGKVIFNQAIVTNYGKTIAVQGSKNHHFRKPRTFPCGAKLCHLLMSIRPENPDPKALVFPSPEGKAVNQNNFRKRAWEKVVKPIVKRNSTPYSCRDTFITEQALKGISLAVIAGWCDTSEGEIRKNYFDEKLLEHIRPIDS